MCGLYIVLKPMNYTVNSEAGFFVRMHWFMQGLILTLTGLATALFMLYVYVLGYPIEETGYVGWFICNFARKFGFLQSETSRAVYFLICGMYVFPLLNILNGYTSVPAVFITLCYVLGL